MIDTITRNLNKTIEAQELLIEFLKEEKKELLERLLEADKKIVELEDDKRKGGIMPTLKKGPRWWK